jgi:hypothetical protein
MRKHLIWYCRDFRGAAELRSKMVRVNNAADVVRCLDDYLISWKGQANQWPSVACENRSLAPISGALIAPPPYSPCD